VRIGCELIRPPTVTPPSARGFLPPNITRRHRKSWAAGKASLSQQREHLGL